MNEGKDITFDLVREGHQESILWLRCDWKFQKTGYLADFYENPEVHKTELEEYVVVIYVKGCIY